MARRNLGSVVAMKRRAFVGAPAKRRRFHVGAAPVGFASIFPGWNVWAVREQHDLAAGDQDRLLRMWVEQVVQSVPGVAVRDTEIDFTQLRGDEIEIIPSSGDLQPYETQEEQRPGANLFITGASTVRFVRFHNRGRAAAKLPWPTSFPLFVVRFDVGNFLLETVYEPTADSPLTSGPPPGTLAGTLSEAATATADALSKVAKVLLIGGGVVLLGVLLINMQKGATA